MDGLMSLTVIVGAIFFYSESENLYRIGLGCLIHSWSLKVKNLVNEKLQHSEILFHWIVSSEWIWWKDRECKFLEGRSPLVLIFGSKRKLRVETSTFL